MPWLLLLNLASSLAPAKAADTWSAVILSSARPIRNGSTMALPPSVSMALPSAWRWQAQMWSEVFTLASRVAKVIPGARISARERRSVSKAASPV
ncbi:hypothetical protein D3C76_1410390 [compost metagenome]